MSRARKNYILFKTELEKEPVLSGSFSSMKRAREAIRKIAAKDIEKQRMKAKSKYSLELTPDGGILRFKSVQSIRYYILSLVEDSILK